MQENRRRCNQDLISRFHDMELSSEESARVESHIQTCPSCRKTLEELKRISGQLKAHIIEKSSGIGDRAVERYVLEGIRKRKAPWWIRGKDALLRKKLLIPATAVATLAMVLFTVLRAPVPVGPSAIVSSVSGDVLSIVILETPKTRQTILWFSEKPERQDS